MEVGFVDCLNNTRCTRVEYTVQYSYLCLQALNNAIEEDIRKKKSLRRETFVSRQLAPLFSFTLICIMSGINRVSLSLLQCTQTALKDTVLQIYKSDFCFKRQTCLRSDD